MANMRDLMVTTLDKYSNKLYDNVLKSNYLLSKLQKSGKIKLLPGGSRIEEDLMYAENKTFKWYKGYEMLDVSEQSVLQCAVYDWKQANANIVISGEEKLKNSDSETRKHNLLQARIQVCETTMQNQIAQALFNDYDTTGRAIEGLEHIINTNPAAQPYPVGGIYSSDIANSWWRNKELNINNPSADSVADGMHSMFIDCTRGIDTPTMIIMDKIYYLFYMESLTKNKRFVDDSKADGSFKVLEFNGVPVYCDVLAPANRAYFINDKYLFFKVHRDANFKLDKERLPYNQDALVFPMIFMGNLTCSNRSLQGVIWS